MTNLTKLLFPSPPRDFQGKRWVKICLRAIHVVFVAGLFGAVVFASQKQGPWLLGTILSGVAILLLDLHGSAAFLLQVRGLIVLVKISAVLALPFLGASAPWLLGGLVVVSVVSSHAPSRFRYFMLLGAGRIVPSEDRG